MTNETSTGQYNETSQTPTGSTGQWAGEQYAGQSESSYTNTSYTSKSQSQAQSQQQTPHRTATLYRHPTEKLVGGVCGGLADYLGWDAALIRILWLVATIVTGGGGLLAYLVLWGLLPVGTKEAGVQEPAVFELNERNIGRVATILIGLGVVWLLSNLGILPRLWNMVWSLFGILGIIFWPALLIGIGYLLLRGSGNAELDLNVDFSGVRNNIRERVNNFRMPGSNNGVKSNMKSTWNQGRKRLPFRRSSTDKLFLGVCGGIGQRLGLDANLIRLLWAAFSIGSIGMGVLIYVALGLLLPEETTTSGTTDTNFVQDVEIVEGTKPHAV